ncbi:hypothetical protein EBR57_10065, partial [bacterium]|nr:hypothetical protein [bacterium]
MRFDNIPKDIPIFKTFHVTVTPRKLTLFEIPLLEYVSILDKYFNYVSQNHTTTTREQTETSSSSSFWLPPEPFAQEPDTDSDQDPEDLLQTHNNNNVTSSPQFFQRTTTPHGFQSLERPATSLSSSSSWKTLLGEGASDWHVAAAITTTSGGMSFLQVMAMYYAHERNLESTPTDPEFRNALIQAMTLDRFLKYHNGNLPAFFRSSNKNPPQEDQVDVEPYEDSLFSKRLNLNDTHQMDLFRSVVASYETFLTHLQSNPIVEYAHVWDLVCDVNPDLMPRGLNLVLIRENGHQSQFVCPTNAYSSMALFDPDKPTAMVLQQSDGTFLPLTRGDDQWTVKHVPQRIKELALHCRPTSSLSPDIYSFRSSITAADLQRIVVDELNGAYSIVQQVASVQSTKIVALQIKGLDANQQTLYVPC